MEIELLSTLRGAKDKAWRQLLMDTGLTPDSAAEQTVLLWDGDTLVGAGSRQGNLLKYIAVAEARQGEGLLATLLTKLRQEAFRAGYRHLFLYTKPANAPLFTALFFYPVAQTEDVLLMEDRQNGIASFIAQLQPQKVSGTVGAAVMNCDPFTLGHRYLIETAAKNCDRLYVFVLSEDKSRFSPADRMEMVKQGTQHLTNVTVLPTGPYLISSATFPAYFLKDRTQADRIHCMLDIEIFTRYFAPAFSISRRYVGTEPLSPTTNLYNDALRTNLPPLGISLVELPRLEKQGCPISASSVRTALDNADWDNVKALVPETTYKYLRKAQQEVLP